MKLSCPACHTTFHLEAALEDEAGREFARLLLQQPPALARALLAYIGLWRPKTRAVSYERALRIACEVLALEPDARRLAQGVSETVEALRRKRDAGDVRPLTGHRYLQQVLASVAAAPGDAAPAAHEQQPPAKPMGKRAQAIGALEGWKRGG